jgi:putative peptidoglycan lipid II flippase
MKRGPRHPLISGVTSTSLGTLASRVLGVVRESAAAGLLGLSKDGIMDAYVVAFRIPNLFRRLFGEGAMTASFLPEFAASLERDRREAWRLVSAAGVLLAAALVAIVLAAEGICGLVWLVAGDSPGMRLSLGLTAAMLPYTVFICLAALVAATLQSLGEFRLPALVPSVLNICWLFGAWCIAPRITADHQGQAYVMAGCVLVGGMLQLLVQLPAVVRLGFRFRFDFAASRKSLIRILRAMVPTTLGLAVTQINTLFDSLLARGFSAAPSGPATIRWLGGVTYPLKQGAAAAVWYGERVYQFPLGLLGIAVATVIFPLLSRHAAAGRHDRVASDLTLGLRLVIFGGVPAAAGLFLLAEPFARLLFERQNFTSADTTRAAAMIAWYAIGVWAFCAGPVLVRAFYAIGDRATPVKIGLAAVAFNFALNLILIWPLGEISLAVSTSAAAILQVSLLAVRFSAAGCCLEWPRLVGTLSRSFIATGAMAVGVLIVLALVPKSPGAANAIARVALPLANGLIVYFAAHRLLCSPELLMLTGRQPKPEPQKAPPDQWSLAANWEPAIRRPAAETTAQSAALDPTASPL